MEIPYNAISKMIKGANTAEDSVHPSQDDPVAQKYDTINSETDTPVEHAHLDTQHEERVQHVVEKEKHQDHYHTTVQPLKAKEVLPEEHDYKKADTQERTFDHEDSSETKSKLDAEKARFKNTSTSSTEETKTIEETVTGDEHVHHHLYETIQPVIEKEIVRPTVTHTTVPIHEMHQEASVVHDTSTAEPMSVDDFQKAGNALGGSE